MIPLRTMYFRDRSLADLEPQIEGLTVELRFTIDRVAACYCWTSIPSGGLTRLRRAAWRGSVMTVHPGKCWHALFRKASGRYPSAGSKLSASPVKSRADENES